MKSTTIPSTIAATLVALLSTGFSHANISLEPSEVETHAQLALEQVSIQIEGSQAEVTGTFTFENKASEPKNLTFFFPVYASGDSNFEQMMPEITHGDKKLEVVLIRDTPETRPLAPAFGDLPTLEGQRHYWFIIPSVTAKPDQKSITLSIRYTQKLADGKFIYTPLIPGMNKDQDYGSITISGDRPLSLLDAASHKFTEKNGKLIVTPGDKRAIVVVAGKAAGKAP